MVARMSLVLLALLAAGTVNGGQNGGAAVGPVQPREIVEPAWGRLVVGGMEGEIVAGRYAAIRTPASAWLPPEAGGKPDANRGYWLDIEAGRCLRLPPTGLPLGGYVLDPKGERVVASEVYSREATKTEFGLGPADGQTTSYSLRMISSLSLKTSQSTTQILWQFAKLQLLATQEAKAAAPELLPTDKRDYRPFAFSPDGKGVLAVTADGGKFAIALVPLENAGKPSFFAHSRGRIAYPAPPRANGAGYIAPGGAGPTLTYGNPVLSCDGGAVFVPATDPSGTSGVSAFQIGGESSVAWWTGQNATHVLPLPLPPDSAEQNPNPAAPGGILISTLEAKGYSFSCRVFYVPKPGAPAVKLAEGSQASRFHALPNGQVSLSVWSADGKAVQVYVYEPKQHTLRKVNVNEEPDPCAGLREKATTILRNAKAIP